MIEPPDHDQRLRITEMLGQATVVVAGAGSGKTRHLVERVCAELGDNDLDPRNLAVITFTERAARELLHRLRDKIGDTSIDDAYIGTIHGFCLRVLRRYPIEAGLPPVFHAMGEISSQTTTADQARLAMHKILDLAHDDPALMESVRYLLVENKLDAIATLVETIANQWDRFEGADTGPVDDYDHFADLILGSLQALIDHPWVADPTNTDRLAESLRSDVAPWVRSLRSRDWTSTEALPTLDFDTSGGSPKKWSAEVIPLKAARESIKDAPIQLARIRADILLRRVLAPAVELALGAAHERIGRGELNFDDLLVLTRRLLEGNAHVRDEVRAQFRQIYVDEFQDTDAVQYDIVQALCRSIGGETQAPSTLFAVGDPKQSIYSFREAEPGLFDQLINDHRSTGGVVALTTNFRTRQAITEWINAAVGARFALGDPELQTAYTDLVAVRSAPLDGPAVVVLGGEIDPASTPRSAAQAGHDEAADIVDLIHAACAADTPWVVVDDDHPGGRPAQYGDIAILIRSRTSLSSIEGALQRTGVPYRVEGGTLMYERREVYELLRVLRAVEHSDDGHAVVTALRTNVFGLSDVDIYGFFRVFRYWNVPSATAIEARVGELTPGVHQVIEALRQIRTWSDRQHVLSPAQLLAEIYDSMLGVAAAEYADGDAATESWRRVRFVIDEARQWSDATAGTIGEYLRWVDDRIQAQDRTDISTDELDNAVRILTIHASKGLEFPIVIVAGLGRQDPTPALNTATVRDGRPEVKLGVVRTLYGVGIDDKALDQAEEARLLYVALTRARDHVVVSVHRARRGNPAERLITAIDGQWGSALGWPPATPTDDSPEAFDAALQALLSEMDQFDASGPVDDDLPVPNLPGPLSRQVFTPSGIAALVEGRQGAGIHAEDDQFEPLPGTPPSADREADDPGNRKDPASGMIQERSPGRYGTSIGIAVHDALQHIPLTPLDLSHPATAADVRRRVEHACARADVVDIDAAEALVRSILATPRWTALVAARRHRREIYVGANVADEIDPIIVWGYIDALYERPDGSLVLVDFKTDSATVTPAELAERYRYQMSAYAAAVTRSTGRPLAEIVLLVGRRDGAAAVEVVVDPLPTADLVAALRATEATIDDNGLARST